MGTHPIFESDFDCLTETLKSCRTEPMEKETATIAILTGATTIPTQMAATTPMRATTNITPAHREIQVGTTTPERIRTPAEITTDPPTSDEPCRIQPKFKSFTVSLLVQW